MSVRLIRIFTPQSCVTSIRSGLTKAAWSKGSGRYSTTRAFGPSGGWLGGASFEVCSAGDYPTRDGTGVRDFHVVDLESPCCSGSIVCLRAWKARRSIPGTGWRLQLCWNSSRRFERKTE